MKEEQKVLGIKKPIIIADYREEKIIEMLSKFRDVKIIKMNLPVADFICSNEIGVERKTYDDFISSIKDGRLFDQAKRLSESFYKPILIIEGFSQYSSMSENAIFAAKASLLSNFGLSLIQSRNENETANIIYWLAKKSQQPSKFIGIKLNKKSSSIDELKEKIIASLPGVSSVIGRRLLEKFGTVEKVITASEKELLQVKGIGKKLAKRIKKVVSEKYHSEK